MSSEVSSIAYANIAFIKYWGDSDSTLHIPTNGSISMNLANLQSKTKVSIDRDLNHDIFILNDKQTQGSTLTRVVDFLSRIRQISNSSYFFRVTSTNNFPIGVGIASSASGFASLALAATKACDLDLDSVELSRLARLGSGSACRSIPNGFVEWQAGTNDESSYAFSIASAEYWDLVDCIAIVNQTPKSIGSIQGHTIAQTSPLQEGRLKDVNQRLDICRQAILYRDFDALAMVVEIDSNLMHAVMMTSSPPLFYWQPETISIIHLVQSWRKSGIPVCYTIDAGPNVHVICLASHAQWITHQLTQHPSMLMVLQAKPGGPAKILDIIL